MINKKLLDINVIKAYLSDAYYIKTSGVYEKIPLDSYTKIGNKLTLNSNGEIVVGAGVSYVEISAIVDLVGANMTTGGKNIVIQKNGNISYRTWDNFNPVHNANIVLPSTILEVQEGDTLSLAFYGVKNDLINPGVAFTHLTVKTIM